MKNLITLRQKIDTIDEQIISLFNERMKTIKEVSFYKLINNLPINYLTRENELIEKNKHLVANDLSNYYQQLYKEILKISKDYQIKLIEERKTDDIK